MTDAIRDNNFVTVGLGVSSSDATVTLPLKLDSATGRLLTNSASGSGDVVGPASATNNAVVRYDGTTGKLVQDSSVIIDDSDNVTGVTTLTVDGDTAAADPATIGYTSAEGLILTGQGSTSDVTIKNDADGEVLSVETGTTILKVGSELKFVERADHESTPGAGFGYLWTKNTAPTTLFFTDDDGTDTDLTASASGNVTGDTASADKELVRFNGTGGKTIESPVTDNASVTATLSDNVDLTLYDATNDGNPVFALGSATAERLTITPNYASGAQTIEFVELATVTASGTADHGEFRFSVDGSLIATIDDGGIELADAKAYFIDTSNVLSETALGSSVVGSSLTSVGVLDGGSITSNFGNIDTGSSTFDTTGAVATGALTVTGGAIVGTGDLTIGTTSANDVQPALKIIGDADSDAGGDTDDTLQLKMTANATPTLATWDFTSTQSAGYKFDKGVTLTGGGVVGVDGTVTALTLSEKTSIALDPAGGADGDYSGTTIAGTGGATIAFGETVYLKASDSEWYKTDASAVATGGDVLVGICVLASTDGNAITVLMDGTIRADTAFPALTIGSAVYLSEVAGAIVVADPTTADAVVRVVGFALTADEIYFRASMDHITVTG